jgi:methyl coenzyme M reductase subunit C
MEIFEVGFLICCVNWDITSYLKFTFGNPKKIVINKTSGLINHFDAPSVVGCTVPTPFRLFKNTQ